MGFFVVSNATLYFLDRLLTHNGGAPFQKGLYFVLLWLLLLNDLVATGLKLRVRHDTFLFILEGANRAMVSDPVIGVLAELGYVIFTIQANFTVN